ncbi:hypothetical protein CEXT_322691 [Caerostris extrusa]|uniref:Uncharacterized protein n=1 Tax=Caerostris extrusa TaxID=172846 RepID=A0AAV4VV81_CAEEX|nr:hypothetical protein CEXT_322691 [Caerostris extrusa]
MILMNIPFRHSNDRQSPPNLIDWSCVGVDCGPNDQALVSTEFTGKRGTLSQQLMIDFPTADRYAHKRRLTSIMHTLEMRSCQSPGRADAVMRSHRLVTVCEMDSDLSAVMVTWHSMCYL